MKKTLLCAALLAALTACDNNSSKTENTTTAPVAQQEQKAVSKALTGAAQAEAAEARLKDLNSRSNQVFAASIGNANPMFKSLKGEITAYQRGEQSSTATSLVTIEFGDLLKKEDPAFAQPFQISAQTTIDHADALANEGIVAKASTKIVLDDALKTRLELDEEDSARIAKALEHLQMDTTLFADDMVEQVFTVKPFEIKENNDEFLYEGLNFAVKFKQSDLKDNPIYPSTVELKSGKLSLKEDVSQGFTLEPFTGSGKVTADGNMDFKTTSIHGVGHNNQTVHIENIEAFGEKLSFDPKFAQYLGKIGYRLNNISITGFDNQPVAIEIKQVTVDTDTQKNGELYDAKMNISTELTTDFVKELAGIPELKINKTSFSAEFNKISDSTLGKLQEAGYSNADFVDEAFLQSLWDDLVKNQSEANFAAAVDTQAGTATAKANIKILPAAEPANESHKNSLAFDEDVVMQQLDIDAEVRIPEAILQKTGAAAMLEMQAGEFLKKENGEYVLIFTLKQGKATLNGQKLPR